MWSQLGLSLAECRVYAYIYGLTNSKHREAKGYSGSKRQLAQLLGLPKSTGIDAIESLTEKHLIVCTDGVWTSVRMPDADVRVPDTDVREPDADVRQPDENVRQPYPPNNPLLNNNTEMERNETIARDTIATPDPQSLFSFERFLSLYQSKAGKVQISDDVRTRARALWESRDTYPFWKKKMLFENIQAGKEGVIKPRLDWTLTDYDPQPTNYRGITPPEGKPIWSAKYNGHWGMYTDDDIIAFGMLRAPLPKVNVKPKV